jgi:DNA polymerase III epsilon subunit-like protein
MAAVFDIETNGFLDVMTKIHVLAYQREDMEEPVFTHDYDEMRKFFLTEDVVIGHNIIRFDNPAIEKLLGIKVNCQVIDTLGLSWYLNHERDRHGLEWYGEDYGIPKPKVVDWDSLTPEDYAHRCVEDVKINMRLWKSLNYKLGKLYSDEAGKQRLISYLNFKLECAVLQEQMGWKLDVEKATRYAGQLTVMKEDKTHQLAQIMPKKINYKKVSRPKLMHKKDGSLSSRGEAWLDLLNQNGQRETTQTINVIASTEVANPGSTDQVKDWLWSLGWQPETYKFTRNKETGEEKMIPQVRKDGELCNSVKKLIEVDSSVEVLEGLTVLTHRLGIFTGFLESHRDGYLRASIAGLTNTLRFKHMKPLVNLPGVDKVWGKEIRECLIAPDGYTLCGADMVSLEDTTKRHYMKPLDPDYVAEMSKEGFDPHLDLAKHAGVITQNDIDMHNSGERSLKALRKNYKVVNYSATYGIGASKLARETGMSLSEAANLLEAFWSRNWSVEAVAKTLEVREVNGSMWLKNPVSGFWYSLRSDKDRFSTLNQGTGVFCFDSWLAICIKNGIKAIGQFHDEVIALVPNGQEEETATIMKGAIQRLNTKLALNVPLDVDPQFGNNYAEIH